MGVNARHAHWVGALACFGSIWLAVGCRAQTDRDRDAELSRLLFAVERVREADYQAKGGALRALEQESCAIAEICALRDLCISGYQTHEQSVKLSQSVRGEMASADPLLLAKQLSQSEALLKTSRQQLAACNQRATQLRHQMAR